MHDFAERILFLGDQVWLQTTMMSASTQGRHLPIKAACCTFVEAEQSLRTLPGLDVMVVDLDLQGECTFHFLSKIRKQFPKILIVALAAFAEPRTVCSALRAGARGYLLKSIPPEDFLKALREAAQGGAPMNPFVARLVLDTLVPLPGEDHPPMLSPRENDVLQLLKLGHTYADVAHALGIRLGTVQGHVKTLYQKLCVSSKTEAAIEAIRWGLV